MDRQVWLEALRESTALETQDPEGSCREVLVLSPCWYSCLGLLAQCQPGAFLSRYLEVLGRQAHLTSVSSYAFARWPVTPLEAS